MFSRIYKHIYPPIFLFMILMVLTGVIYPLIITGIAQYFFPWQANGSLINIAGHNRGSLLIGQQFDSPTYFWGRPSETLPFPYNASASSGSNLSPTSPIFLKKVNVRMAFLLETDPKKQALFPIDLLTASASGLDPEISPLAAFYQVPRVAKARNIPSDALEKLVNQFIKNRTCALLGEPRVNVLELNIGLDELEKAHDRTTT